MTDWTRRTFLQSSALTGAAVLLPGCMTAADAPSASDAATASASPFDGMARALLAEYPEGATAYGYDTGALAGLRSKLTDRSPAGVAARAASARARLAEIRAMMPGLSASEALDADVVATAHENAVEGYDFGYGEVASLDLMWGYRNGPYAVAQNMGAFVEIPDFLTGTHPLESDEDAAAYVERVRSYADQLAGETERLREDRGKGVVAPDFIMKKTLATLGAGLTQPGSDNMMTAELRKAGYEQQAATVAGLVDSAVKPALAAQIEELKRHAAIATSNAGVWDLPRGDDYYRWALKAGTTTTLSPQEVHHLGREKLAEVHGRMEAILRKQGMTSGTIAERMDAIARRPGQVFPNTDAGRADLLTYVRGLVDDIRARMPQAFETLVPGYLEVVRVPPEIEAGAPGGSAMAGSADGKQPGRYNINLRDTADNPKFGLPTLTYHEAIPGHVWQGEYAFKQPLIRTLLTFNAYSEGWALYAEQLANELGVYADDPFAELGYLQSNAFRCCRLVVDTGMHGLRWTRDQALDFFVEGTGSPRADLESEIDRYCVWPGQACGYKVGEIAINRARDRAKAALGSKYDLRKFNDAVVLGGNVPMTVLDRVVDRYIARAKG